MRRTWGAGHCMKDKSLEDRMGKTVGGRDRMRRTGGAGHGMKDKSLEVRMGKTLGEG